MGFDWRPLTSADISAWNRLLAAAEEVDRTGDHYNEADLAEELADPDMGPDDRVAAWLGDQIVAYAGTRPRGTVTDHWRIDGEGCVHPAYRGQGLGSQAVAWAVERAMTLSRERQLGVETRLQLMGRLDDTDQVALLEGQGWWPSTGG